MDADNGYEEIKSGLYEIEDYVDACAFSFVYRVSACWVYHIRLYEIKDLQTLVGWCGEGAQDWCLIDGKIIHGDGINTTWDDNKRYFATFTCKQKNKIEKYMNSIIRRISNY